MLDNTNKRILINASNAVSKSVEHSLFCLFIYFELARCSGRATLTLARRRRRRRRRAKPVAVARAGRRATTGGAIECAPHATRCARRAFARKQFVHSQSNRKKNDMKKN